MFEDCSGGISKTLLVPNSSAIVGTAAVAYGTFERDDEKDDVPPASENGHCGEILLHRSKSTAKGLGTRDNGVNMGVGLRDGDDHRNARWTSPYSYRSSLTAGANVRSRDAKAKIRVSANVRKRARNKRKRAFESAEDFGSEYFLPPNKYRRINLFSAPPPPESSGRPSPTYLDSSGWSTRDANCASQAAFVTAHPIDETQSDDLENANAPTHSMFCARTDRIQPSQCVSNRLQVLWDWARYIWNWGRTVNHPVCIGDEDGRPPRLTGMMIADDKGHEEESYIAWDSNLRSTQCEEFCDEEEVEAELYTPMDMELPCSVQSRVDDYPELELVALDAWFEERSASLCLPSGHSQLPARAKSSGPGVVAIPPVHRALVGLPRCGEAELPFRLIRNGSPQACLPAPECADDFDLDWTGDIRISTRSPGKEALLSDHMRPRWRHYRFKANGLADELNEDEIGAVHKVLVRYGDEGMMEGEKLKENSEAGEVEFQWGVVEQGL